ncbi:MAG TPA: NAD(P)-dependent alcohol dehydrogenase [Actinomycetota bacterium]|jgi:NADPH:quinone reductase-like Zn-dependent oxidoreductase|nr:NAD(P)-dependent alcohol dehydrogenase [Actinomycetota bacterium]
MRAVVQDTYGSAETLELRDVPRPAPADGEVLVRVRAAGLDRGVWHVMTGLPYMVRLVVPTMGLRRPKAPIRGMDLAGQVEAVGRDVTRFRPGDAVFGWTQGGSYAEYAAVPSDQLVPMPANLSFEQAAAVPISGLAALQGIRDVGEVQAGQRVLVIGAAGGVGSFAVQLAKAAGAHVTGVAGTTQAELVRAIGADEVIDYTREDVTDGSRHWDLILDTAGHRSLSRLRRALSPAGTLVIVGSEVKGRLLGGFDRQLRAVALSRVVGQRLRMLSSTPRRDDLDTLRRLLEAGKVTPLLDRTFPLDQVRQAIGHLLAGGGRGKIVITV